MKNEGAFAVEWIAYHLSIGFDHIIVFTNDCDDGTVSICKLLEKEGLVTHIHNDFPEGQSPQQHALEIAITLEKVKQSDWTIHIDVDEFILVELGDGKISELTEFAADADAIALLWRAFGDMGYTRHNGGLVHERFLKCQENVELRSAFHKTLFRPASFDAWSPHMPKDPVFGESVRIVNSRGREMPKNNLFDGSSRLTDRRRFLSWDNACLHHYAVRSEDLYLMKNDRGDVNKTAYGEKYFLGSAYHRRYNLNQVYCSKILKHSDRFHATFEMLMAIDGIRDAVRSSEDWFVTRRSEFLTEEMRGRLTKVSNPS